jgi:hypothetical protein
MYGPIKAKEHRGDVVSKDRKLSVFERNGVIRITCTHFHMGFENRMVEYLTLENSVKNHFRLTNRVVHGTINTLDLVKRHQEYPIGSVVRMGT